MTDFFVISIDRANQVELDRVQSVVKNNANGWWHRHATVWIVGGLSASEWRDLIKPKLSSATSGVLVLGLPDRKDRSWSYSGLNAKEKCNWIHENYR